MTTRKEEGICVVEKHKAPRIYQPAAYYALNYYRQRVKYTEPYGENGGEIDKEFNRSKGDGSAWCSLLVLRCFELAGLPLARTEAEWWRFRAVKALCQHSINFGVFFDKKSVKSPQKGDVVFFYRKGGTGWHAGLCVAATDDHICTVEGNVKNTVVKQWHSRKARNIRGYGRFPRGGS